MLRPIIQLFTILLFGWCFFSAPAMALDIKNVRFGAHPDKTRMVIDLSGDTDFRAFMLPREENRHHRLVVDLPKFSWQAGTINRPPKTTVLDVRSGTLTKDIDRIVVDLQAPALIKSAFVLPRAGGKPDRLVVDFKTVSENQFINSEKQILGQLVIPEQPFIAQTTDPEEDAIANLIARQTAAAGGMIVPPRKPSAPEALTANNQQPSTPLRKPLIIIDAGHGGADPGAVGYGRLKEKNITLSAAKELKKQLEATGRYRVDLTRHDDRYLKLYKRVSIAREKEADLFISLHADSIGKSNVRGASIYTLSNKASDEQTAKLAARENRVDLIAGVDLSHEDKDVANILIDLAMRDTMNQSKFFANTVVVKMRGHGVRILEKPHRYAGFAVLKAADIPSVLVEMGFMSNKNEATLLASHDYQRKIAAALVDSVDAYFAKVQKNGL